MALSDSERGEKMMGKIQIIHYMGNSIMRGFRGFAQLPYMNYLNYIHFSHTREAIGARYKPTEYTEIPRLELFELFQTPPRHVRAVDIMNNTTASQNGQEVKTNFQTFTYFHQLSESENRDAHKPGHPCDRDTPTPTPPQ